MALLPVVEREVGTEIKAAVIWLHGLGADGNDFAPIVPDLNLPHELGVRFIFPHAPEIAVTINDGYVMPAWFDILEADIDRKVDAKQLRESAAKICDLITHEIERGIPSEKIVVAGFSQGGAVAYEVVLSHQEKLGGLLAMSTYFATSDSVEFSKSNRNVDILVQHGEHDDVVQETLGKRAAEVLTSSGYKVTYQNFPMAHAVCPEQISDIGDWLTRVLKN